MWHFYGTHSLECKSSRIGFEILNNGPLRRRKPMRFIAGQSASLHSLQGIRPQAVPLYVADSRSQRSVHNIYLISSPLCRTFLGLESVFFHTSLLFVSIAIRPVDAMVTSISHGATRVIVATTIFTSFALLFVGLRIIARLVFLKSGRRDEIAILVSMVSFSSKLKFH